MIGEYSASPFRVNSGRRGTLAHYKGSGNNLSIGGPRLEALLPSKALGSPVNNMTVTSLWLHKSAILNLLAPSENARKRVRGRNTSFKYVSSVLHLVFVESIVFRYSGWTDRRVYRNTQTRSSDTSRHMEALLCCCWDVHSMFNLLVTSCTRSNGCKKRSEIIIWGQVKSGTAFLSEKHLAHAFIQSNL